MSSRPSNRARVATALFVLVAASRLLAGPLSPPIGPVTSTGKTTSEVEPRTIVNATNTPGDGNNVYVISQSGSYYLAGNMLANTTTGVISINASDVTLDLSGFTIDTLNANGLRISGDRVTIRNGTLICRQTGAFGLNVFASAEGTQIERMNISMATTGNTGIYTASGAGRVVVSDCKITGGTNGVYTASDFTSLSVNNVIVEGTTADGINAGNKANITNCTVSNCGTAGTPASVGIRVASDAVVRNCTVTDTLPGSSVGPGRGIQAAGIGVMIEGCTVYSNGPVAMEIRSASTVRNNTINQRGAGTVILVVASGTRNFIADNHVISGNFGVGVQLGATSANTVVRNYIAGAASPVAGTNLISNIVGAYLLNGGPVTEMSPHANYVN